jgi:hypothetical protein
VVRVLSAAKRAFGDVAGSDANADFVVDSMSGEGLVETRERRVGRKVPCFLPHQISISTTITCLDAIRTESKLTVSTPPTPAPPPLSGTPRPHVSQQQWEWRHSAARRDREVSRAR